MAKFGIGKVFKIGSSTAVRLPISVVNDDGFGFKAGEEVVVKIVDKELLVGKA